MPATAKDLWFVILAPDRTDLYWRPASKGYTTRLGLAGVYSAEEAESIVSNRRGDRAVSLTSLREEMVQERIEVRREADGLTEKIRLSGRLKGKKS